MIIYDIAQDSLTDGREKTNIYHMRFDGPEGIFTG